MADGSGPIPKEALDYVKRKELRVGFDYRDVWLEQHAQLFTVAKVTQAEVLAGLKTSLEQALERGETFESWVKNIRPELEKAGWWGRREVVDDQTGNIRETDLSSPHRLRTIYEHNMRTARGAAQWQRIQRTKRALPYLLYQIGPSVHHREEHVQWHGILLPVDHPFWTTHFAPNGWGCKCHIRQVGKSEYERLIRDGLSSPSIVEDPKTGQLTTVQELRNGVPTGRLKMERKPVQTEAPPVRTREWINKRTGEIERVPVGIDPGWDHNPGITYRTDQQSRQYTAKLATLPPDIGAETWQITKPRVLPVIERDFKQWGQAVIDAGKATGEARTIGAVKPQVIKAMADRGVEPKSAAIMIRDRDLLHASRDAKQRTTAAGLPKALTTEELLDLPGLIDRAEAALLDERSGTLLLVYPAKRREAGKLVVALDYRLKSAAGVETVNVVKSASLLDLQDVAKDVRSGRLVLLDGALAN